MGVGIASLNYLKELVMPPNIKHYVDGFEKDTLKWNQNLTYESMLRTQKKNPSLRHNMEVGKNKHISLFKTKKDSIKEDIKQNIVNGKTNMMVRNISRSDEASAKWKQQLSKDCDSNSFSTGTFTNKNTNIKSNGLERRINRSDEVSSK